MNLVEVVRHPLKTVFSILCFEEKTKGGNVTLKVQGKEVEEVLGKNEFEGDNYNCDKTNSFFETAPSAFI